ncbi:hypothetical protein fHeYen902_046c [Yersinia phage fHe-Yen9-02]|nr:hypothetical protein fHeYen902_046c [Yersinia phage fHe-Yen9-02]
MELKLEQFVNNVEVITNIHSQNKNPIMFRMPSATSSLGLLFYCAYTRPRYVVLPINAIWIDYDPESMTFKRAFKRTVKHSSDPYQDVWTELYFYADATADQQYDPADLVVINTELPPLATSLTHGIGYLSYPEATARVIIEGDASLTDNRPPLDHTHPEKPASMISINGTTGAEFVPIQDQSKPLLNQILVLKDNTVQWRKLKEDELS